MYKIGKLDLYFKESGHKSKFKDGKPGDLNVKVTLVNDQDVFIEKQNIVTKVPLTLG